VSTKNKPQSSSANGAPQRATTIQSVARASRILLLVATRPGGIPAKLAADHLGLTLPTTYHLLATLVSEGLLTKDSRRRYVLGPKAGVIADAIMRDNAPPEYYAELLRELAADTQETAYLSAWRSGDIQIVAVVEGEHAVRVTGLNTGKGGFPHARASGKLLLAYARPELREQALGPGRLQKRTPHTITSRARLEEELARVREQGYAIDREEYSLGVACISAPVIEDDVVLAAFTVSVPTERFAQREDELRSKTLAIAAKASRRPVPG
jgi:IclR family acetate operon transcriptional repressor